MATVTVGVPVARTASTRRACAGWTSVASVATTTQAERPRQPPARRGCQRAVGSRSHAHVDARRRGGGAAAAASASGSSTDESAGVRSRGLRRDDDDAVPRRRVAAAAARASSRTSVTAAAAARARQSPVGLAPDDLPGRAARSPPASGAGAGSARREARMPAGRQQAAQRRLSQPGLQASLGRAVGRQEQEVDAGAQRHDAVDDAGAALRHGLHVHGIGDRDAPEARGARAAGRA